MSIQNLRQSDQQVNTAILIAQALERRELQRGGTRQIARRSLAGKLRIGSGTIENLIRGRVKGVDASIRDRLQALLIRELEQEIGRLQHELDIARQSGAPLNSDQVGEIETHISKARALLKGAIFEGSNNASGNQGRMRDGE